MPKGILGLCCHQLLRFQQDGGRRCPIDPCQKMNSMTSSMLSPLAQKSTPLRRLSKLTRTTVTAVNDCLFARRLLFPGECLPMLSPKRSRSLYALTPREVAKGMASRIVYSQYYIFLYLGVSKKNSPYFLFAHKLNTLPARCFIHSYRRAQPSRRLSRSRVLYPRNRRQHRDDCRSVYTIHCFWKGTCALVP